MIKSVIVTGVSRGIGRAVVEELFASKESVIVTGIARSEAPLKRLKEQFGDKFFYVVGDITDRNVTDSLVQEALKHGDGEISSVIANAGVLEPVQNIRKANVNDWKQLFNVNFFSVVELATLTLPHLVKTRGNLIFVSSGASTKHYSGWGAYGASKAALNHLALTISKEAEGVRTISVAPGVVDTQMQVEIREKFGPGGMAAETVKRFQDLKTNGNLLNPKIPAKVYTKLALQGIPDELNGEYVRYNDERLD